ncbi:hypothetical protein PYCCODRAFT_1480518 [Trametes coccinea BRFM310]|uniref:Uncharacterized protein n=1 Tax=Trametes coccinea (strain BRFM310) TaxID=1353009 RepID=A0A1Y2IBZ6_TRAC3|nr:hypothetical protein PYCCODRAFT_1480518 [Trametes coccinea BRFM310]
MLSRLGSKRTTRRAAAASSSAARDSAVPETQPSTSSSFSPMRTRSGKLLIAPLADTVKTVKSKLTRGRRAAQAPETAPATKISADAEATAAPSIVPEDPAPAARKAPANKRATKTRGRSGKGKTSKAKSTPKTAATSTPAEEETEVAAPAAGPSSEPITAPAFAPSPSAASVPEPEPRRRPVVRESHRLTRQGAFYFDKNGRALPQGTYPWDFEEVPAAEPSLLELVAREVSLEEVTKPRLVVPGASIYPGQGYNPKYTFVYEPLEVRIPGLYYPAPAPASASASAMHAPPAQPAGNPAPIVFPSVPAGSETAPVPEPAPTRGMPLTRQYAAFFDENGQPLPTGREGSGELDPIGEMVANILKAQHPGGPYPSTWRGSLFEPEPESAAAPAPTAVPAPAPAAAPAPSAPSAAPTTLPSTPDSSERAACPIRRIPLTRQGAVYFDKDGFELPPGVTTTAAAQFPSPKTPRALFDRSQMRGPRLIDGVVDPSLIVEGSWSEFAAFSRPQAGARTGALGSLFARRSQSQLAAFERTAETGLTEDETQPAEASEPEPAPQPTPAPVPAPAAEAVPMEESASTAGKGKKRAREPEEDEAADEPLSQRLRIHEVSVRTYTTQCSLLRAKVSIIPIPAPDPTRGRECELLVIPADEEPEEPSEAGSPKRSREEFEEGGSASEDAEEPRAKKARVD